MAQKERRVYEAFEEQKNPKSLRNLPAFKSEEDERDFWAHHDSTDYIDWTKAARMVLPSLRPSVRTISLRLPVAMIARLKVLANKHDVPYQSLLKVFLAERLTKEMAKHGRGSR